jgi:protein involved in polysaccharide export with SLBB domain
MHHLAPLALRVCFISGMLGSAVLALGLVLPPSLGQAETGKQAKTQTQPAGGAYRIAPPDVLAIESLKGLATHPVHGAHQVRPDGSVGVGAYGSVYVKGLTLHQAREASAALIHARMDPRLATLNDVFDNLSVDVLT